MTKAERRRLELTVREVIYDIEAGRTEEAVARLLAFTRMERPRPRELIHLLGGHDGWTAKPIGQVPFYVPPVWSLTTLRAYAAAHPYCEVCGAEGASPHHLIPRSFLRLDVEWNLLGLCAACHLASSPRGFHRLGPRRWLRSTARRMAWYTRRRAVVVLFVVWPWLRRNGRSGQAVVRG